MSRLIIFVRHGESEANKAFTTRENKGSYPITPDPSLSETGKKQAEHTGQYLTDCFKTMTNPKITVWYSPFLRTMETAAPFVDKAKDMIVDRKCVPELQEYTRISLPDSVKKAGCIEHHSYTDFINRLRQFKEILWHKYQVMEDNEHLVIFAHSLVISNLLMSFVSSTSMLHDQHCFIHVPNCSISCVRFTEKQNISIYTTASIAHLPPDLVTGTHVPFNSR